MCNSNAVDSETIYQNILDEAIAFNDKQRMLGIQPTWEDYERFKRSLWANNIYDKGQKEIADILGL